MLEVCESNVPFPGSTEIQGCGVVPDSLAWLQEVPLCRACRVSVLVSNGLHAPALSSCELCILGLH
jgi:hypothetical protein